MLTGSCLCESVRFELRGRLGPLRYCHCSRCRRATGSAFSANSRVRAQDFEISTGRSLVSEYEMSPGVYRAFCSRCGSQLYARIDSEPEAIRIRLGTFNDDPGVEPVAHVWVASKASWFEITDQLPQFQGGASDT